MSYCERFRMGPVAVTTEMASFALGRARLRWDEGLHMGNPLSTVLAAIYLQGMFDASDALERKGVKL